MKLMAALVMLGTSLSAAAMSKTEQQCLAVAIYHEARGEGIKGWKLVADLVNTRSKSGKFAKGICSVIRQKGQFTYDKRKKIKDYTVFNRILKLVASNSWLGSSKGAMWYHNLNVRPRWRHKMQPVMTYGHHIFYRWSA